MIFEEDAGQAVAVLIGLKWNWQCYIRANEVPYTYKYCVPSPSSFYLVFFFRYGAMDGAWRRGVEWKVTNQREEKNLSTGYLKNGGPRATNSKLGNDVGRRVGQVSMVR